MLIAQPAVFFHLHHQYRYNQQAPTDKTHTDGGIIFKHLGVSKAWNVLACCDMMIDGGVLRGWTFKTQPLYLGKFTVFGFSV